MSEYVRLLRENPDYARLWFSQVISLTGDWFATIVLFTLVASYAPENTGLAISGLILSRFVPPILISPIAGMLVDRFNRKRLLVLSNLLRAVVALLYIPATTNADLLWTIYALSVVQFFLSAVFEPGQSAITPSLVPHKDLVLANTLASITWSAMLAIGAIIGGIVSTIFGANIALVFDSVTFVVAAWLIWQIRTPQTKQTVLNSETDNSSDDTSIAEGLRYLRRTPSASTTLLVKFGGSLGNVDTLLPIFATQIFVLEGGGQLSLAIMYSFFGLGAVLGPLLMNRFNDGSVRVMRRLIILGFIGVVFGWMGFAAAPTLLLLCLAIMLRAMGGSTNWTYSSVMLQKTVPDNYLGRVFSMDMAGFYLATVASTLIQGPIIDLIGSEHVRIVAVGTMFVSLIPLAVWILITRWLERRETPQPEPEIIPASVGD
jgi:MFS family permease